MRERKYNNTIKRGRLYHKTISITFASRLLQIGDDQGPHADDVGYNINKMKHTQVVGQERGERTSNHVSQHILAGWRWIRSWRARPNYRTHSKLSAVNTVEIGEGQKMVSQWVSNGTHCPDTRKKLPRGQLSHRWLTPPTHQAPMHPLFNPILTFLDEDRCCSDPALSHKLS